MKIKTRNIRVHPCASVAVFFAALRGFVFTSLLCGIIACKPDDMADQPRYKPLAPSTFYPDGASARDPVPHTIPTNAPLAEDSVAWRTPITNITAFPFTITREDLLRGQQRFQIDCTPCHGILGDGDGMVPQRGFTRPPTFHSDRLRAAPPFYFYNVITNGIGAMYPYNDRVSPDDRWRIAAYIKALQLSQHAPTNVAQIAPGLPGVTPPTGENSPEPSTTPSSQVQP